MIFNGKSGYLADNRQVTVVFGCDRETIALGCLLSAMKCVDFS